MRGDEGSEVRQDRQHTSENFSIVLREGIYYSHNTLLIYQTYLVFGRKHIIQGTSLQMRHCRDRRQKKRCPPGVHSMKPTEGLQAITTVQTSQT